MQLSNLPDVAAQVLNNENSDSYMSSLMRSMSRVSWSLNSTVIPLTDQMLRYTKYYEIQRYLDKDLYVSFDNLSPILRKTICPLRAYPGPLDGRIGSIARSSADI